MKKKKIFFSLTPVQKGITLHSSLEIKMHNRPMATSPHTYICRHSVLPLLPAGIRILRMCAVSLK